MKSCEFANLVRQARTRRRYVNAVKVSRDEVVGFIDTARNVASAMNAQPLRYRVVTDAAECEAVFQATNWAKGLRTGPAPAPEERPSAWVIILSVGQTALDPGIDVGIAAQTINLAASAAGYATCMLLSIDRAKIAEALKLPEGLKIQLLMSVGKPGEQVAIEEFKPGVQMPYWRTQDQVHHVPKRKLEDVLI